MKTPIQSIAALAVFTCPAVAFAVVPVGGSNDGPSSGGLPITAIIAVAVVVIAVVAYFFFRKKS